MSSPWTPVLFALAAAGLLRPLTAALSYQPLVADPGPCAPPRDASAAAGLRGYARFHANDSLIGCPVPCTRDQKICFRHNLIFDPESDRCEPIGGGSPACDLRPNRTEFEHGSGHIVGVCQIYEDPCPGYRMAYDGRCYHRRTVIDVICGCGAEPIRHIMGGVECRDTSATPISVQQPEEEDRCLIPDLRFPDKERAKFFNNPLDSVQGYRYAYKPSADDYEIMFEEEPKLECSSEQAACFAQEQVWVNGHSGCYNLLEKGPCNEDHIVALDGQAALQGRAEVSCVHNRGGCPVGEKRMAFDGECHEDRKIQLESPRRVHRNQFGQYTIVDDDLWVLLQPRLLADHVCQLEIIVGEGPVGEIAAVLNPPCGENDKKGCHLFEVENEPPKPE